MNAPRELDSALARAAKLLRAASSLVVGAGAGMGVDSGLPDFRGTAGFWRAYPPLARLGLRFEESANPALFERDVRLGWGFYGHRLLLYRRIEPHAGFRAILDCAGALDLPWFVVTSNVDGHFVRAGFAPERVCEVHGSIHHAQCFRPCGRRIWTNEASLAVDEDTLRLTGEIPTCPDCGGIARPNILMFGDAGWLADRTDEQAERYRRFLEGEAGPRPLFLEIGAGTAVPTIRCEAQRIARLGGTVVRLNLREAEIAAPHLAVECGAEAALLALGSLIAPQARDHSSS